MREGAINLYSDTQTRPCAQMRQVIAEAPVGDEQHGADPSVIALCRRAAALLGKEAAVFLPSGTMCNEIAIAVHCRPGDEIYAHHSAHVINFEGGGPSAIAGAAPHGLPGERGLYRPDSLAAALRDPGNRYAPRSRLVCVEQTSNMGGGAVWPLAQLDAISALARQHDLHTHMDGARLMNAVVASGVDAATQCRGFDSCWIDLSKGLGCPMGGVLAGSEAFIDEAWRWKQRLGGALRQAGMMAAAGLFALEHRVQRLAEDHDNARRFAEIVSAVDGVRILGAPVETNLVFVDVSGCASSAPALSAALEAQGINIGAMGPGVLRAVTHLDVTAEQVETAANALVTLLRA
jgi:threonine aldolase